MNDIDRAFTEHTFMYQCIHNGFNLSLIDVYIGYWHNNETGNSLREFLGMTRSEYLYWITNGNSSLKDIIEDRKSIMKE